METNLDDLLDDALETFNETRELPSIDNLSTKKTHDENDQEHSETKSDFAGEELLERMKELMETLKDYPDLSTTLGSLSEQLEGVHRTLTNEKKGDFFTSINSNQAHHPKTSTTTFQEKISSVFEDLRLSETQSGDSKDPLGSEILEGIQSEERLSDFMGDLFQELLSKEMFYEPMKELNEKFPKWFQDNQGHINKEDIERYRKQYTIVQKIVAIYEKQTFKDDSEDLKLISQYVQEMQEMGQLPSSLINDIAPGFDSSNENDCKMM